MITNIAADRLYQIMKIYSILLIDMREFGEYEKELIEGAINWHLSISSKIDKKDMTLNAKVIIYSKNGDHLENYAHVSEIFSDVFNLEGGIDAWKECDLPVVSLGLIKKEKTKEICNKFIFITNIVFFLLSFNLGIKWFFASVLFIVFNIFRYFNEPIL